MNDVSPHSLDCCMTGIMSGTSPPKQSLLQPLFDALLYAVDAVHVCCHIDIVSWPTNSSRCINLWCGVVWCVVCALCALL